MRHDATSIDRNRLIASAAGTLQVLEKLGEAGRLMSVVELAKATARPKSTVHRVLSTLVNTGFVEQDSSTEKYRLTIKMWRLGISALNELDLIKIARPHLEALMNATDETVHLAVLDTHGDIVYISKVESARSIRVQTQIGRLSPSWCTATGRSLLAFNPAVLEKVMSRKLAARTPRTITDAARLRKIIGRRVAQDGYAVTKAENHPEMGGIAAPIHDHTGSVIASCGIAIPAFRMDEKLVARCIPFVIKTAGDISAALGFSAHAIQKQPTAA